MAIKPFLFLICLFTVSCTVSQKTATLNIDEQAFIPGNFSLLKVDKLGNIYLINKDNELIKYDDKGTELFRFSSKRYGHIAQVDLSNPLKILLYFNDYQTILFLDNTLSEIKQVFLEEMGYWNTQVVASSNDNRIWVFDQAEKKLKKINDQGNVISESNTVIDYDIADKTFTNMIEEDNMVYIHAQGSGVMVFDNMASFVKINSDLSPEHIQISKKLVYYLDENMDLIRYENPFDEPIKINIELKQLKPIGFHIESRNIYVLTKQGLYKKTTLK